MAKMAHLKTKHKTHVKSSGYEALDETTKLSISLMGGIAALVGGWAAVSLISAMISVGGPLELVRSWFHAAFGF